MKAPLTLIAIVLLLSACSGNGGNHIVQAVNATNKWVTEDVYTPGYQAFADQTSTLVAELQNFCSDTANTSSLASQNALKAAIINWQVISHLVFEPLSPETQQRIQFFPDENSLVSQQVDDLLASSGAVTTQTIANATAPVQGLPALEYLLFGDNAAAEFTGINSHQRCDVVLSIARHLATRSAALNTRWAAQAERFSASEQIALGDTSLAAELAIANIRDNELGNPLGLRGAGAIQPQWVETPWAKVSFETLEAALSNIEEVIVGDGDQAGLYSVLSQYQQQQYADRLLSLLTEVKGSLALETTRLFDAVSNPDARNRLTTIFDGSFSQLRDEIQTLGQRMNIDDGFNASDGD